MTAAGELPRASVACDVSPNKNKPFGSMTRFWRLVACLCGFFRLWRCFVSDFGGVLFPTLAEFYFRLWRSFTSDFGGVLLPTLAEFYFRLWRSFTSDFGGILLPTLAVWSVIC
jgi:hypothetical protein